MTPSAVGPVIILLAEALAPHFWLPKFYKQNTIVGLEMLAR